MAKNLNTPKNFDFSRMDTSFPGYNSANDPTKIDPSIMVGGSLNVYKKINGNIGNRPGKALYSPADTTSAPVTSGYVWNKSNGNSFVLQVANSKLQALNDGTWYDILTGLDTTRWVFDTWYDQSANNDYLTAVDGTSNPYYWSGGITTVLETNTTSIRIAGTTSLAAAVTSSGTVITKIVPYLSSLTSNTFAGNLVGKTNPSNGETLIITLDGVAVTFTFVTTIGATPGNVLIGANIAATMTNLLGLFNAPSTTNATQVALTGAQLTAWTTELGSSSATQVIINSGTNSWIQDGFSLGSTSYGTSDIIIDGVTYTRNGGYDVYTQAIGVSSVAGITLGSIAIQAASVGTGLESYWGTFMPNFIKTIDNQVYYGSYTSQLCYVSTSTNPNNLVPASPQVKGSANLITFDGPLNGITVKNGKPYMSISGNKWGIVNYTYSVISTNNVRQTSIEYTPTSAGSGAYAHEFIDTTGDSIVYLAQDQQVRMFGSFNTSFTSNNYPSLSQEIYTELQAEVFSNDTYTGNLRCIGDYIYLTSPISGYTYLYQARQAVNSNNQVIVERLWHSPMTWNLTRVDVIDNTVLGFSKSNPQIYQLWDTDIYYDEDPTGETFAYTSTLKFAYDGGSRRQGLWSFDKIYTEGYIQPSTTLTIDVFYNFNGAEALLTQYVNSTTYPASYFPEVSGQDDTTIYSLGDVSLGQDLLGESGQTQPYSKFKAINQFALVNTFEWQTMYQSTESGARWEILAKGHNAKVESEQDGTFIINKQ